MTIAVLEHRFVESFPRPLEPGVLYISTRYSGAAHACACECGREVVTPLSPTDWFMVFNGKSVSLFPSIGNWQFPCRSHYWLRGNRIIWSYDMTEEEIEKGRAQDLRLKADYFGLPEVLETTEGKPKLAEASPGLGLGRGWARFKKLWWPSK